MTVETARKTVAKISEKAHPDCVVCGLLNARGLHLMFEADEDEGVKAEFNCDKDLEGYPGILHGGVISTILDGAMGHCMFARGLTAVTVEMKTRFRHPIKTGDDACVKARITRSSHPLYLLQAEIVQNNQVKATAKGKFYDQPELKK
mgnify:CR=1 FL=1